MHARGGVSVWRGEGEGERGVELILYSWERKE